MKFSTFAGLLSALVLACSCSKDNTILYSYNGIGDVSGENILADNGLLLEVVQLQGCDDGYKTLDRIIFHCDILRKNGEGRYQIRLTKWNRVLRKEPVKASEVSDWSLIGDDAVMLMNGWTGGEYLNTELYFAFKSGSDATHHVNLVFDDVNSDTDTLRFTLHHNGVGESYPDVSIEESVIGRAYASFPVRQYIPEGQNSIAVKVSWDWYTYSAEGDILPQTATSSISGTISR